VNALTSSSWTDITYILACFSPMPQSYRSSTAVSPQYHHSIIAETICNSNNCDEAIRNFGELSPKKELRMPFAEFRIIF